MILTIRYMNTKDYKLLFDAISWSGSKRYVNKSTFKMLKNRLVSLPPLKLNARAFNCNHSAETQDGWTNLDEQNKNMSNMILLYPMKGIFYSINIYLRLHNGIQPQKFYIHGSEYTIMLFIQTCSVLPRSSIPLYHS